MLFQFFAILGFGAIAFQDIKERMVYWFLFPMVALFLGFAFWQQSNPELFLVFSLTNLFFVSTILLISFLYTKYVTRKPYLNHSLGLGDLLFFYALAFGFPTLTFIVLFVSALIFSLVLHTVFGTSQEKSSVPLAGYMSLFLMVLFLLSHIHPHIQLYLF